MIQTLIGKKVDQTQTFLENGKRIPVTHVSVADNFIVQVKTPDTDAYTAVQLGVGAKKKPIKARLGHSKKAGLESVPTLIKEVSWIGDEELPKPGDAVTVASVFSPGDIVKVTATSKGKGFAGVVKRHNFRGGPKTHGQSDRERAPGSIGQTTTPGRVYKGKRMAGHMGVETVTIRNLIVVAVDPENNELSVTGLVPGNKKSPVIITKIGEQKKFVRLLSVKLKEDEEAKIEAERLAKEQEKEAAKAAKAEAEKPAETAEPEKIEEAAPSATESETVASEEIVAAPKEAVADAAEETVTPVETETTEEPVHSEKAEKEKVEEK